MIFSNLMTSISKRAEVAKVEVKAHSPEILIGVGIAGMVTSTVLACRATLKADDILKQRKENLKQYKELADDEKTPEYTEEDLKKDTRTLNIQTGLKVAGLYAPAVAAGVLGASCFIKSNSIHKEREASAAAAYALLDQTFKKYRDNVIAKEGTEADQEYRHGTHKEKIKNEEGKKETVTVIDSLPDDDYSMFFDASSPFWEKNRHYNETHLLNTQALWNKTLRDRASISIYGIGTVTLLEVYRDLGISVPPQKMKKWKDIGWCINTNDPYYDPRNEYIDLGIGDMILRPKKPGDTNCSDVMPGYDPVFIITPNVQGNIYTMMG